MNWKIKRWQLTSASHNLEQLGHLTKDWEGFIWTNSLMSRFILFCFFFFFLSAHHNRVKMERTKHQAEFMLFNLNKKTARRGRVFHSIQKFHFISFQPRLDTFTASLRRVHRFGETRPAWKILPIMTLSSSSWQIRWKWIHLHHKAGLRMPENIVHRKLQTKTCLKKLLWDGEALTSSTYSYSSGNM